MSAFLTKIFSVLLAIVAFFVNTSAKNNPTKDIAPEGAVRVSYGDGACEFYDMFIPENVGANADVLLTVHGGAWIFGNGSEFNEDCREAAKAGFVAVNMDYQKIQNGVNAYDMVDEIGTAIASIKTELENLGITPDNIILAGHSAGAHLSLMYAYTHYNDCPVNIAFVVSNCAPTDFYKDAVEQTTQMGKLAHFALTGLTGNYIFKSLPENQKELIDSVSPVTMVTSEVPPTIVVQGDKDEMVPFSNSADLYNALVEAGVDAEYIVYENATHMLGDKCVEGNKARAEAFYRFCDKYC